MSVCAGLYFCLHQRHDAYETVWAWIRHESSRSYTMHDCVYRVELLHASRRCEHTQKHITVRYMARGLLYQSKLVTYHYNLGPRFVRTRTYTRPSSLSVCVCVEYIISQIHTHTQDGSAAACGAWFGVWRARGLLAIGLRRAPTTYNAIICNNNKKRPSAYWCRRKNPLQMQMCKMH